MNDLYIFIARLILGMVFGVLLTRIFRPEWSIFHGIGMGLILVAVAYLMQMMRNRKKKN
ncbi:MAG: hypothetical protein HQK62_00350 [Desulfamplus sp.]|nr:hypothetical protein [Desulfamplus sp.]MBF0257282.1 hypothetical protein [Desulfamplus sp.]